MSPPQFGQRMQFGPRLTPVVKNIIFINVGIYLLSLVARNSGFIDLFINHLALSNEGVLHSFKIWQLLTYSFLHFGIMHLMWNMIGLWMFGCHMEGYWGRRPFLLFYLLCAFVGGCAMLAYNVLFPNSAAGITLGASGAVIGIIVAFGTAFANREIHLLFPPVALKAKWLAIGIVVIDVLMFLEGGMGTAFWAHFGGALTGFAYVKSKFRFSNSPRLIWRGLTLSEYYRRWRTRRHLRVIVSDQEKEKEGPRPPTYH